MRKEEYIRELFSKIARPYDRMNKVMTLGLVKKWRLDAIDKCALVQGNLVLDVCTGTGEMAFLSAKKVGMTGQVVGLDNCPEMLDIARKKQTLFAKKQSSKNIYFIEADALALPCADNVFDCVITAFALRNISDIRLAIGEMVRVCKKNGRLVCLEISEPLNPLLRIGFRLYFHHYIPWLGKNIIRPSQRIRGEIPAYQWLSQSLKGFPQGKEMTRIMEDAGLDDTLCQPLSGGIVTVYYGRKT